MSVKSVILCIALTELSQDCGDAVDVTNAGSTGSGPLAKGYQKYAAVAKKADGVVSCTRPHSPIITFVDIETGLLQRN